MKLLLTGASGFIGEALVSKLVEDGHELVLLSRAPSKLKKRYGELHTYYTWDALSGPPNKAVFDGVEGIINLMGEGVANKRWTKKQKEKISQSRVKGTKNLMDAAKVHARHLNVVVSASAIGYYDHFQDSILDELSPASTGFLGKLCQRWEDAAKAIREESTVRTVIFRIGVVLGQGGGALAKMVPPFSLGLGGKIGSGNQWMNWVHRDDVVRLMASAIKNETFIGNYNAVAPENVQNNVFTAALGRLLRRPTFFQVPSFIMKFFLGEFSGEVLYGQKIVSNRLKETGFDFYYPDIDSALEEALSIKYIHHLGKKIRCFRFQSSFYLNQPPQMVFDFFSDAKNLEKITPPFLQFNVLSQSTREIENGTIFNYRLKIRGVPIRWCSLITDWKPITSFVDTQLNGPYQVWHHTHRFIPYLTGVFIEDDVHYALPNIPFINIFLGWYIRQDVSKIFQFRRKEITRFFKEEAA